MEEKNISPEKFVELLHKNDLNGLIVDVREPHEWEYYHLDDAVLIPMNTIPDKMGELPEDRDIYVVCAHGVRSAMVCRFLRGRGMERVTNVQGGMAAVSYYKDGFQYD